MGDESLPIGCKCMRDLQFDPYGRLTNLGETISFEELPSEISIYTLVNIATGVAVEALPVVYRPYRGGWSSIDKRYTT